MPSACKGITDGKSAGSSLRFLVGLDGYNSLTFHLLTLFLLKLRKGQYFMRRRCFYDKKEAEILNRQYDCSQNTNVCDVY